MQKILVSLVSLLVVAMTYQGHVARAASVLPAGFTDTVVLTGLELPTVVAFSPDGRIFVAEKSGLIKVFDSLSDPTAAVFADLRTQVHNYGDRGLLGMALDPGFPATPYVYVLYTRDADIGGTAPKWGTAGVTSDPCPNRPEIGCVASGRLSRLRVSGGVWAGSEQVLVDGWFQQFDSHSMGSIAFGGDGALYASGGDGASWQFVDYGQAGSPLNPGGDPPVPVGGTQTPPTAEGGALRAQDLRTEGDPVGLNGTVIRVNPATGAALPDNPQYAHPDVNAKRIVAYGFRNPYRIAARPESPDVWVGDVGWLDYEEINIISDPTQGVVRNFGWPCYNGPTRQSGYDAADLDICENLYSQAGAVASAHFQYREGYPVVTGEGCTRFDSSLSGLAFYQGGSYPLSYNGALFFADFTRRCIWAMPVGVNDVPDPAKRLTFAVEAANPVDLKVGPGGDLFYVDLFEGAIHRIEYPDNAPPEARFTATPTSGLSPLNVTVDGRASRDPEGSALTFAWDLDGDGAFDDGVAPTLVFTYTVNGTYTARLRVTNAGGRQSIASTTIFVGNSRPAPVIDGPAASLRWRSGQSYTFSGHATDAEDGALQASALSWSLFLNHCSTPTSCHVHPVQDYARVASGAFIGPEHEDPSYLTLRLTATDSAGLQQAVERRLDPLAVAVTLVTSPPGLQVVLGGATFTAPTAQQVIAGSHQTISAPTPQTLNGVTYTFASWSDGGAATHPITVGSATSYVATFTAAGAALPASWSARDIGAVGVGGSTAYSDGTFAVRGAGADVWGSADAFHFASRSLTGDGEIVARVASIDGTQAWTKAGVMIRNTLDPSSAHAFMLISTGKGFAFQRRPAAGAASLNTAAGAGTAPQWVRLSRRGQLVTASVSADGTAWATAGTQTMALNATVFVGLAVSSHDPARVAAAAFDSVTVRDSLPAGWQRANVGAVGINGTAAEAGGTFTVRGAGADVWGTADAFNFAYTTLAGDGQIVARIASAVGTNAWTKVGVMLRESLDPGARHAFMLASVGKGFAFQRRTAAGGMSISSPGQAGVAPRWVRLARTGNLVVASLSADGVAWTTVASDTIAFGGSILAGLAVSSHDPAALATGTFDHVTVDQLSRLPDGWSSLDIGAVGRAGSAAELAGSFTMTGAGADVWGTADAFRFAYRSLNGDGEIVARVATIAGSQPWTKAGVMIRELLTPGSPHAFMLASLGKGLAFQRRSASGTASANTTGAPGTAPVWVRLVRTGQTISAFSSSTGTAWTPVGQATISMAAGVYVGVAVSSHDPAQTATATFDRLSVVD